MKVRHKRLYNEFRVYEVLEESPNYYIVEGTELLHKSNWEPVPVEPTYRDVTGECEFSHDFNRGTLIHYCGESRAIAERFDSSDGYRLRKVQLKKFDPPPFNAQPIAYVGGPHDTNYTDQWAFIVERKEP